MADILSLIANPTVANVPGQVMAGRMDAQKLRQNEQELELNQMKLGAAKQGPSAQERLKEMEAKAQIAYQVLGSVRDEASYQVARQNLQGVMDLPEQFDPNAVEVGLAEAAYGLSATTEMGKAMKEAQVFMARGDQQGAAAILQGIQDKYSKGEAPKIVPIYDAATGASAGSAVAVGGQLLRNGQPLPLEKYTTEKQITKAAQGTPGEFGIGVTKPVANRLQTDISEGKVQQAAFKRITELYSKDFLTLQGKIKGGALWALDKIDALPKGQQQEWLAAKTKFDTGVNQAFNIYRRWVTGAAAAMSELERLEQAYINVKDSPTQFVAKLAELSDFGKRVEQVRMDMLKNGLNPDDERAFDTAWKTSTVPVDEDPTTAEEMVEYLQYQSGK